MMADSSQTRIFGGGWWSVLALSLVALESDSCIFPLRLHASASNLQPAFLTDGCQLSQSEASCCHDLRLISACASCLFSCLCMSTFLGHHDHAFLLGAYWRRLLLGMHMSSILVMWPAQCSCTWSKMDLMLGRLTALRTSLFDTKSCPLVPRMERKQCWWNHSCSLICLQ